MRLKHPPRFCVRAPKTIALPEHFQTSLTNPRACLHIRNKYNHSHRIYTSLIFISIFVASRHLMKLNYVNEHSGEISFTAVQVSNYVTCKHVTYGWTYRGYGNFQIHTLESSTSFLLAYRDHYGGNECDDTTAWKVAFFLKYFVCCMWKGQEVAFLTRTQ